MARKCEITGKTMMIGHNVSHSNIKTNRRFNVNLQNKKFYIPEEKKWITLRVSTSGMRTIDKKGIFAAIREAREKGYLKH